MGGNKLADKTEEETNWETYTSADAVIDTETAVRRCCAVRQSHVILTGVPLSLP